MMKTLASRNPSPGPAGNPGPPRELDPSPEMIAAALAVVDRSERYAEPIASDRPAARRIRRWPVAAAFGTLFVIAVVILNQVSTDATVDGVDQLANQPTQPTPVQPQPPEVVPTTIEDAGVATAEPGASLAVIPVGVSSFSIGGQGYPTGALSLELCTIDGRACTSLLTTEVDAEGAFHRRITISPLIAPDEGQTTNCQVDLCVVRVVADSVGRSSATPIDFGSPGDLAEQATFMLSASTQLDDGQTVTMSGAGWPGEETVKISQCGQYLICGVVGTATTDAAGTFRISGALAAFVDTGYTHSDCSAGECRVLAELVGGTSTIDQRSIPLDFAAGATNGFATVVDDYVPTMIPGDVVTIAVSGATPGDRYEIAQCTDGFHCADPAIIRVDEEGLATATLVLERIVETLNGPVDCVTDGGCYLTNRYTLQGTPHSWGPVHLTFAE